LQLQDCVSSKAWAIEQWIVELRPSAKKFPDFQLMLGSLGRKTTLATQGIIIMHKHLSIALTLLALVGVAPLLGACHTTAGAGQDLSAGGHAITNSADKHTP
jgi:predicted small secreted protein